MVVIQSNPSIEIVGMGVKYEIPVIIPPEEIWTAMLQKIYQPEKCLPVTNVKVTDILPERYVHREMVFMGRTLKEDIYPDKQNYRIRFVVIGEGIVRINEYDPNTGILEYYQENEKSERIIWEAPKAFALKAMEHTHYTAQEKNHKVMEEIKVAVQEEI